MLREAFEVGKAEVAVTFDEGYKAGLSYARNERGYDPDRVAKLEALLEAVASDGWEDTYTCILEARDAISPAPPTGEEPLGEGEVICCDCGRVIGAYAARLISGRLVWCHDCAFRVKEDPAKKGESDGPR